MNNASRFFAPRIATLLCSLLAVGSLLAAPPAGKGPKNADKDTLSGQVGADVVYDSRDGVTGRISAGISFGDARQVAERHGMTGAKPLPPGIRKNLARGKPLPPGIARQHMPAAFTSDLPRHDGYEWRQAGGDLVLVASGTLVIEDILSGVFD
jgi:Ni/Co efflux regulator RcnB